MPFARTLIDPAFDRDWIAKTGGFITSADELDVDGRWLFCANDLEAAGELIESYPVRYLEKRLPEAKALIEARAAESFLKGFTPSTGPLAGHTLQCRDSEDRTNWLASSVAYSAAISAGMGAQPGATFRTADNSTVTCTFSEGFAALLDLQRWGSAIMGRAWALKDACAAAADIYALDDVLTGLNDGWPDAPAA